MGCPAGGAVARSSAQLIEFCTWPGPENPGQTLAGGPCGVRAQVAPVFRAWAWSLEASDSSCPLNFTLRAFPIRLFF